MKSPISLIKCFSEPENCACVQLIVTSVFIATGTGYWCPPQVCLAVICFVSWLEIIVQTTFYVICLVCWLEQPFM